jgi:hypothetical protein
VLTEPGSQLLVVEQIAVAGDDRVGRSGYRRGYDGSIGRISELHVDVHARKKRRDQDQDIPKVFVAYALDPQLCAAEDVDDFVGELPRGDSLEALLANGIDHLTRLRSRRD